MKEYEILEETERYDLIRKLNDMAKDHWNLVNFFVIKGTYHSVFYAVLEREIDANPSQR